MELQTQTIKRTRTLQALAKTIIRCTGITLVLAAAVAGCTTRTIEIGGVRYHSVRFANKETIGPITVKMGTNSVTIGSYVSDQVTGMAVVVEAAVSAAIKGVKP